MNAYELADLLGNIDLISGYEVVAKAQTMLRQQADEIQALKDGFNTAWGGTNNSELAEVRAMANRMILKVKEQADRIERKQELIREQTALLVKQNNRIAELEKETHSINYTCPNCETHVELFYKTPQIKELSDEELWEIWDARIFTNPVGFYRTAIKKASEK